ncbi:MAG TPA: zf-HC2 domain-containing protein [Bryobacteraceae bacterium]|nr:zf-HC2 domain-containing protein [Bryobacteraceae bacterium]
MAVDGELPAREAERVASHLAACWACRARKQEMEGAIGEFVRFQRDRFDKRIPSPDGPRALLKAQLEQLAAAERASGPGWWPSITRRMNWTAVALALLLVASSAVMLRPLSSRYRAHRVAVTVPDPRITPGATILAGEREVCMEASIKNKAVPVALQRRVFAEYGIRSAEPGAYEVDYLITPALGGADDIHNLWPQSTQATEWNAQVKDALEDHLRDLVCEGQLDLSTAQREIAGNWIEAYKKYFHTDQPLTSSR